jgi:hypothetical protein
MANRSYSAQQMSAYAYSQPHYVVPAPRRVGFWRDVYNGAVLGDFAREKRLGGALTQIIFGFTPGVGTICAARDCIADLRYRDALGFILNLLALIPVFGGVSKTLDVILGLWHAHHVLRARGKQQRPQQSQQLKQQKAREQPAVQYLPAPRVPTQPLPALPPLPRPSHSLPPRQAQAQRYAPRRTDTQPLLPGASHPPSTRSRR